MRYKLSYTPEGKLSMYIEEMYDAGVWTEDDRYAYVYDFQGRLASLTNTDVSAPNKVAVAAYTYEGGKLATTTITLKKDNVVDKESRIVWNWNTTGGLERQTVFSRKSGSWVELTRLAYTYDSAGRPSALTVHKREAEADPWKQSARNTWTYGADGKLSSYDAFSADENGKLQPLARNTYTWLNGTHVGELMSEIGSNGTLKKFRKTTTTFTSSGSSFTWDRWITNPAEGFLSAPLTVYGRFVHQQGL
ncbi:MAG: hypothetical protein KC502_21860 [Myxococcales bacterium]|nr:hypothetical protein [Myxococcales bacterium]